MGFGLNDNVSRRVTNFYESRRVLKAEIEEEIKEKVGVKLLNFVDITIRVNHHKLPEDYSERLKKIEEDVEKNL